MTREGGEKFAITILPAYICRRPAEREVVREVVKEATALDEAFETLRALDPPIDRTQAMVSLCRQDWTPGVLIDDYFYQLKLDATRAQAPLRMVCTLLIPQFPTPVQGYLKDWLATKEEIDSRQALAFIDYVRQTLSEKGIALDKGTRDFTRVCKVEDNEMDREKGKESESLPGDSHDNFTDYGKSLKRHTEPPYEVVNTVRYQSGRKWGRQQPRGGRHATVFTNRRTGCFICGVEGHFARYCTEQFCQHCGKKGHDRRDCKSRNKVMLVDSDEPSPNISESAVVVRITLNDFLVVAMLDSGAQPSIIDKVTLSSLGVDITARPSHIHGVGKSVVDLGKSPTNC